MFRYINLMLFIHFKHMYAYTFVPILSTMHFEWRHHYLKICTCNVFTLYIHIVPLKSVDQISTVWTNGNSVIVSWDPLSLLDCRGFPYYIVSCSSPERGTTRSVSTTSSSVIISGLDPQDGYIFTLQVTTGNGTINGPVTVSELKIILKEITTFGRYPIIFQSINLNYNFVSSLLQP